MTETNQLSAAARYRAIRDARRQTETTVDVTSPSGMVWTLRRPNIEQFIVSGKLPVSLAAKLQAGNAKGLNETDAFNALNTSEQAKVIEATTSLVRYVCVNPRIVDDPQTEDEIAPEDILLEDFTFLAKWASQGGEGDSLEPFRNGRQRTAVANADGGKVRKTAK